MNFRLLTLKYEEIYHEPHEQGANLDSGEINYKYACSRYIEGSGVFVRYLIVKPTLSPRTRTLKFIRFLLR